MDITIEIIIMIIIMDIQIKIITIIEMIRIIMDPLKDIVDIISQSLNSKKLK